MARVRFIHPMYDFDQQTRHIAVPEGGLSALHEMWDELHDTGDLIAIYIPESTSEVYSPDSMHGLIVGTVRLEPMPSGHTETDYFYDDYDGTRRWPHGWPCAVVRFLQAQQRFTLRGLVEAFHPSVAFGNYVARLQIRPIKLDGDPIGDELTRRLVV